MQNIDKSAKIKIYSVLGIFGIISVLIIGWWIWSDIYCGKLILGIAPESSNITINGKNFKMTQRETGILSMKEMILLGVAPDMKR